MKEKPNSSEGAFVWAVVYVCTLWVDFNAL